MLLSCERVLMILKSFLAYYVAFFAKLNVALTFLRRRARATLTFVCLQGWVDLFGMTRC